MLLANAARSFMPGRIRRKSSDATGSAFASYYSASKLPTLWLTIIHVATHAYCDRDTAVSIASVQQQADSFKFPMFGLIRHTPGKIRV